MVKGFFMNKTIMFSTIFFGFAAYVVIGIYTLSTSLETIKGTTGIIWTQMRAGFEKLDAIESQLGAAYKDRKDIVNTISAARAGYAIAASNGNIDQAVHAATTAGSSLKILVENYPSTDLSSIQTGVLDETAGIFNRIAYARQQLINAQVQYNQNRILFFIVAPWFTREQVLGEMENPMAVGPKSKFA